MARPSTLIEPWLGLASKLGSAGAVYALLREELGCGEATAKRICWGTGQLTYAEWCKLDRVFREHHLPLVI